MDHKTLQGIFQEIYDEFSEVGSTGLDEPEARVLDAIKISLSSRFLPFDADKIRACGLYAGSPYAIFAKIKQTPTYTGKTRHVAKKEV